MSDAPPPPASRPVTVKAVRNGPLQVKGTFRLLDPDGEEYDLEGQRILLLCRCGRSKNQPFCDSSHTRYGFETADQSACADKMLLDDNAGEGAA